MALESVLFYAGAGVTFLSYVMPRSMLAKWLILLPGVAAHELAHWALGLISFSRPGFPNLIPKRQEGGWMLGSVAFIPGTFTAAFVALAPLYLLPALALLFVLPYQEHPSGLIQWFAGYFFSVVLLSSWPSRADWTIAFSHPLSFLVLIVATIWGLDFLGLLSVDWSRWIKIVESFF